MDGRVLKQQRIQELTDMLLQIDENISMMSEVLATIGSMTCHSLRFVSCACIMIVGTRIAAEVDICRRTVYKLLLIPFRYDPPNTKAKRVQNLKQRYRHCVAVFTLIAVTLQAFLIRRIRFGQMSQFAQSAADGDAPSSAASATSGSRPVQVTPQKLSRYWAACSARYFAIYI